MAKFNVKPKNQLNVNKKPRVYFTCHPEDFEKYFQKICEDVFKTHDCAIYYTEDMEEAIAEDEKTVDLGRNNLFVVPVTYKLLSTPNRAMDEDIPYAFKHHIPVLPIMMESGIDVLYSKPDKFGELQYLNPFSTDLTEISYEEKLKKYLESILISNEMAERVRTAFDAYIFLSYRKKDRKYANELMRLVHSNPACRDIAIWFDEFLTPGESFRENIDKILKDSKLFTLLVTPNLLEEPDGKPNFVMKEEFPTARDMGKSILPAEMVETDKKALSEKFKGIPQCVNPNDAVFYNQLLDSIEKIATEANNTPEHNYLIGLAYLEGIDVEVNREFALEIITFAAEAGLPEAMQKLYQMYNEGIGVEIDYRNAVVWAEKFANYMMNNFGEENTDTISSLNNLALGYSNLGEYQKAKDVYEIVYKLYCKTLGEKHYVTLSSLSNLGAVYYNLKNYPKMKELLEKSFRTQYEMFGLTQPGIFVTISNIVQCCISACDYQLALDICELLYDIYCKEFGEEHTNTVCLLNKIAIIYGKLGEHKKALEFTEKSYKILYKTHGEKHPHTLKVLGNLAFCYDCIGNHQAELEINEKVYADKCKILGKEHPDTIVTLNNLSSTYYSLGDKQKAVELCEGAYSLYCKVLGEKHPDTLTVLNNLANYYSVVDHQKAQKISEEVYAIRCEVLGGVSPDRLKALRDSAGSYFSAGDYQKARELFEEVYNIRCNVLGVDHVDTLEAFAYYEKCRFKIRGYELLGAWEGLYKFECMMCGEEHPDTLEPLDEIAQLYSDLGEHQKSLEYNEKAYTIRCKVLGENHPQTITSRDRIEEIKKLLSEKNQ